MGVGELGVGRVGDSGWGEGGFDTLHAGRRGVGGAGLGEALAGEGVAGRGGEGALQEYERAGGEVTRGGFQARISSSGDVGLSALRASSDAFRVAGSGERGGLGGGGSVGGGFERRRLDGGESGGVGFEDGAFEAAALGLAVRVEPAKVPGGSWTDGRITSADSGHTARPPALSTTSSDTPPASSISPSSASCPGLTRLPVHPVQSASVSPPSLASPLSPRSHASSPRSESRSSDSALSTPNLVEDSDDSEYLPEAGSKGRGGQPSDLYAPGLLDNTSPIPLRSGKAVRRVDPDFTAAGPSHPLVPPGLHPPPAGSQSPSQI
jgi:hypothetical protein